MHVMTVSFILLTVSGIVFAVQPALHWWITAFIWMALFVLTNYVVATAMDKAIIRKAVLRTDNLLAYTKSLEWLLATLTRMMMPRTVEQDPKPKRFLERLVWRMTPRARDDADLKALSKSPFSWPVFDLALRVALAYPLVLMLILWGISGQEIGLGSNGLLSAEVGWGLRTMFIWLSILLILCWAMLPDRRQPGHLSPFDLLPIYFVAIASIGAVAFAYPGVGSGAVALVVIFAGLAAAIATVAGKAAGAGPIAAAVLGAVAGISAGEGAAADAIPAAVATIVAFTLAVVSTLWVSGACERGKGLAGYVAFTATLCLLLAFALANETATLSTNVRVVILGLAILPIVNAVFDYLSYGLTLKLVIAGKKRRSVATLGFWIVDAMGAVVLLVAVGTTATLYVGAINTLGSEPFFDLVPVFNDLKDPEARGQYTWLYLTLMTTLVPTAVHAVLVFLSVFTWVPHRYKVTITGWVADENTGQLAVLFGTLLVATIGALYALAATLVVLAIYYGLAGGFEHLAMFVLSCVEWIATAFGVL